MRLLLTLLTFTLLSFANNQKVTIIDNKVKKVVTIDNLKYKNSGFIIDFKKNINIKEFEKRYKLKLKTKMQIGLYIFYNYSNKSDLEVLKEILKNDKNNIKSIFINSKNKNQLR